MQKHRWPKRSCDGRVVAHSRYHRCSWNKRRVYDLCRRTYLLKLFSLILALALAVAATAGAASAEDEPCASFIHSGLVTMNSGLGNGPNFALMARGAQSAAKGYADCSVYYHNRGNHKYSVYAQTHAAQMLSAAGAAFHGANDDSDAGIAFRYAIKSAQIVVSDGQYPGLVSAARDTIQKAKDNIRRWSL
jgi:hypothetical protein